MTRKPLEKHKGLENKASLLQYCYIKGLETVRRLIELQNIQRRTKLLKKLAQLIEEEEQGPLLQLHEKS